MPQMGFNAKEPWIKSDALNRRLMDSMSAQAYIWQPVCCISVHYAVSLPERVLPSNGQESLCPTALGLPTSTA